ncbi:uncharacterized protein LOC144116333 isoform X2 [Amblyomma americanum]
MPSCCVPGCRSRTPGQEPGVTFHTFPKDPERRRQWTEAVRPGQRDWEPAKWTCVCSKHFLPEHFDRMSPLVVRIRADAVPLQQEPLSQQPGDGTAVAATALHGAQQALTQSHTSPASPLQQAPMDVAESQETLAGPSQQAPMDVTESQETTRPITTGIYGCGHNAGHSARAISSLSTYAKLPTLPTAPASVGTPRRRRPAMDTCSRGPCTAIGIWVPTAGPREVYWIRDGGFHCRLKTTLFPEDRPCGTEAVSDRQNRAGGDSPLQLCLLAGASPIRTSRKTCPDGA